MGDIGKVIAYAKGIASDDSHGYSQLNREGVPDFDCSSLVRHALNAGGFDTGTATYTGNMYAPLIKAGFKDVKSTCNMITGSGLKPGDVLLSPGHHTALYIGNGRIVHAVGDEKGGHGVGAKPGDQTGREIREDNYYNRPGGWTYVLRPPQNTDMPSACPYTEPVKAYKATIPFSGNDAYWFQWQLRRIGHDIKIDGEAQKITWARMTYEIGQADKMGVHTGGVAGNAFRAYLRSVTSKAIK